jgi:alpha-mannosidase
MTDRRSFLGWLSAVTAAVGRSADQAAQAGPITVDARPTPLYQQPDGRNNLLRVTVTGLAAPAARARVIDRRGTPVGTAGLLPSGTAFAGEVWVPLSGPADFRIEVEVGKKRVARTRVRVVPPRRWTLYWLSSTRTDVGSTDLQERCLEIHRANLDAALARLSAHPAYRWTAECAYQVISYVENRSAAAADALLQAIRDGKIGFQGLFANLLTGLLDHETYARLVWPAGLLARERGLAFAGAQLTGVPGQPLTFPTVLAASGVRYLATCVDAVRALPLLDPDDAARYHLTGEWTNYPQLYWWEGPDGSRVLHWRGDRAGTALRFGFDQGPDVMARRLSNWLQSDPVLLSPGYPYDVALLYGALGTNSPMDERLVDNVEEFNRRFAFPKIVPARAEEFFREIERRYGPRLPVRRGDTGLYKEDGAASTAAELARFRQLQLAARAAELLALWDDRTEARDSAGAARARDRAAERRVAWQDLLLFGEHTWGAQTSVSDPDGRQTVAQWQYKRRFLDSAGAAVEQQLADGLLRIGTNTEVGTGRVVFNASGWPRSEIVRVPGGAGRRFTYVERELPAVDLPDGSALVVMREVPALGYLRLTETDRAPNPPTDDGQTLEADAGGFHVTLDPGSGAIRSLKGPDGKERVDPSVWSGLNQVVYVVGGRRSALWTDATGEGLATPPDLGLTQSKLVSARRERLPGIGVRLVAERALTGFTTITSMVTLYDELPWIDIENRITKPATLEKEALYVAFPFALTKPTVEVEVPLGRMTVEQGQQPGSCRDWYCHTHWVWLHAGAEGVLWSGPDTPLFTLTDVCRGAWRRRIEPDGTLFAYVMNNYWPANFAARQGGELRCRFRLSLLAPGGDAGEPVRRGWAAADPLYVSARFTSAAPGPLIGKDSALFLNDPGALVLGAKRADDGDGVIVKLLDVAGTARQVGVWPAGYTFAQARRVDLVERNGDPLPVAADRHATLNLGAWGVAAARLFTPPPI